MIPVQEVKEDVYDQLLTTSNGEPSFDLFNRFSRLAELDLMDWLSGKLQGKTLPDIFNSQKDRDSLSPFIKKFSTVVTGGVIIRPKDYYQWNNIYLVGDPGNNTQVCVDEDEPYPTDVCDRNVEILDSDQFNTRCVTYIKGLQPSLKKPIAKEIGNDFEFKPKDCGAVRLEYFRYPVYGKIVTMFDAQYNEDVVNVNASTDYEWNDNARGVLIWLIVDRFANRTSNMSLKQMNAATPNNPG